MNTGRTILNIARRVLWTAVITAGLTAVDSRAAVLIEGGKARAQIVLADKPSRVASDAATLVQSTLQKMTGVELPIVRESSAGAPPSDQRPWIAVGETRLANSRGIVPSRLRPEEIRVVIAPASVILAGNESSNSPSGNSVQQGTYYAAVEFLERLGVRWLWPGESGEVIPRVTAIDLGPLDYAFAPKLFQRHLRFAVRDQAAAEFKYGVRMDEAGLGPGDWPDKMRLGHSRLVSAGHGFGDWYERYFKEHPEYFAVGEDGKSFGWLNAPARSKQCLSNPGTLEQVIQNAKAEYDSARVPSATCFSLSPNDNQAGHCMCENCRAMDALDGPKESWNFYSADGQRRLPPRVVQHVSLTDRHVKFWNAVAERLEPECPGMMFGAYAYGVYRHPPLHVTVRPSILIGYVGGSYANDSLRRDCLEQWDAWSEKAGKLMFRPNLMKEGYGFPLLWPVRMAEDIRHYAARKLVAADIPNIHGHWGTQGLNYYVLGKVLWNPDADPGEIISDYCAKGFGPAAPAVHRYYTRLIELTDQLAAHNGKQVTDVQAALARDEATEDDRARRRAAGGGPSAWEVVYTPQVMAELESCLTEARQLAGDDAAVLKRVAFLATGFDYAKLDLKLKQAQARVEREPAADRSRTDLLQALVELEAWRKQNAGSLAIGVVAGHSWFLLPMREISFVRRFQPAVRAARSPGGDYRLDVLAFSSGKRIAQVQFSADGRNWSAAQPYVPQTTWRGSGHVHVRFLLEDAQGGEWSPSVETELP